MDNWDSFLRWYPSADSTLFPLHYEVFQFCRWAHKRIPSPLWATGMVWPIAFQWFSPTLWNSALHISKAVLSQGASSAAIQSSFSLGSLLITGTLSFTNPRCLNCNLWLFNSVRSQGCLVPHPCAWIRNCLHVIRSGEDACLVDFPSLRDHTPELPVVQYLQTVI